MTMSEIHIRIGDCVDVLKTLPSGSVARVSCDPPYGISFMSKDWDKVTWQEGGAMSKPGIGDRNIPWPSYGNTGGFGTANPSCAVCKGRLRGAKKCSCEQPEWRVNGDVVDVMRRQSQVLEDQKQWHMAWLKEVYRVLEPGGKIQAFAATKTYHRLAAAMSSVGFVDIEIEAFGYGSGFPKSHAVGKSIDRMRGLERPVIGQKKGVVGDNINDVVRGGTTRIRDNSEEGAKSFGAYGTGVKQRNAMIPVTGPADEVSAPWEDWSTALKPAWEPIVVGRKPLG